jgi:hypothetical protein
MDQIHAASPRSNLNKSRTINFDTLNIEPPRNAFARAVRAECMRLQNLLGDAVDVQRRYNSGDITTMDPLSANTATTSGINCKSACCGWGFA